jgi:RNA polymerase sigma-70 factor (ECF subfamily)
VDSDTIRSAWTKGREQFPRAQLDEDAFRQGVAALGVSARDLPERAGELYLVLACLAGDAAALAEFDRTFVAAVARYVAHFPLSAAQLADLQQDLRVRLLAGARPRLGTYSGRAALGTWIRVIAIRAALDMMAARDRPGSEVPSLDDLVATYSSPDLALARHAVRPALQEALREGMEMLSADERTVLRLHFVDGLNIDAIGRIYQVHRSTVGRWLITIRTRLFEHVRGKLALDLAPSPSELRSMFRLVKSDLRLSIDRLLGT